MCGRFTLHLGADDLARELGLALSGLHIERRFNIAPGQSILVLRPVRGGLGLQSATWGLVPSWSRDPAGGPRPINARSETAAEKPMFRGPFRTGRCVVPASGFYEWQAAGGRKQPWYIHPAASPLFLFAGLAARREGPEGPYETCAILTTAANALMAPLHDRMPVILRASDRDRWLDPAQDPGSLGDLLAPFPAEAMAAHPVGPEVGSPRRDGPGLIAPAAVDDGALPGF